MRLKSEIWVKAYIRRLMGEGVSAVVARRGDSDAGVILIKVVRLDGTADLYGPAPAGFTGDDGERRWTALAQMKPEADVEAMVAQERRLDGDIWVVEVEDRSGRSFLEGWLY